MELATEQRTEERVSTGQAEGCRGAALARRGDSVCAWAPVLGSRGARASRSPPCSLGAQTARERRRFIPLKLQQGSMSKDLAAYLIDWESPKGFRQKSRIRVAF